MREERLTARDRSPRRGAFRLADYTGRQGTVRRSTYARNGERSAVFHQRVILNPPITKIRAEFQLFLREGTHLFFF